MERMGQGVGWGKKVAGTVGSAAHALCSYVFTQAPTRARTPWPITLRKWGDQVDVQVCDRTRYEMVSPFPVSIPRLHTSILPVARTRVVWCLDVRLRTHAAPVLNPHL